jgi:adenylate cyclase
LHLPFTIYNLATLRPRLNYRPDRPKLETALSPASFAPWKSEENSVVLNDRRVSRKHAYIFFDGNGFKIVDGFVEEGRFTRSVNHVFVNGQMQLEHALAPGDVVMIGESRIEFAVGADVVPADVEALRSPSQIEIEKPAVSFDDAPLGHTQVKISVNELMGRRSDLSLESATATPAEIKDLRRKAKILELLYELSKTLGTVFELDEIFERATDLIFRGTPADRVVALLAEEAPDGTIDGSTLYQIGARTRDANIEKLSKKLAVSRTITQKVMTERLAILSQAAKTDEQFQGAESIVSQGVRSTICAAHHAIKRSWRALRRPARSFRRVSPRPPRSDQRRRGPNSRYGRDRQGTQTPRPGRGRTGQLQPLHA